MALNDEIAILSSLPILKELEPSMLRRIAFSMQTRILRDQDKLYQCGETAEGAYVVMSGEIMLLDADNQTVAIAKSGDLLGENALLIEAMWQETAVVRGSASVLRLSRALMHQILSEFPVSANAFRAVIVDRISALAGELESVRQTLLALDAPNITGTN